ncbi:hypothetical protein FOMPIDRAFT_94187 [Fomitopsis schrenkii]|uniref:Uncharacterized protein n=1 Tax=Fomitopsis schrenkii TaxID=2126942 RepID=S8DJV1_FOMSC|nr:hypothetical protein FOMPIDRAFT_94187 [Fomitopsis schrenkii]
MPIIPEADELVYEVTSRGSLVQDPPPGPDTSAGGINVNTVPEPAKGTKSSGSSRPRELARNGSYSH